MALRRNAVAPAGPQHALWKYDFEAGAPSVANDWTLGEGSFFSNIGRHGFGIGWASDCHGHKYVGAQTTLAAGVALRHVSSVTGYTWTADTDGNDFGIMSFCGDSGATCHIYLDWDGTNHIQARLGRNGTVLATSSTPTPNSTVGQWVYVEGEVLIDDTAGYVKVWQDDVQIINFTGDTRNAGTSTSPDTVKMGGFWPQNLFTDDLYINTVRLGDPGDVATGIIVP